MTQESIYNIIPKQCESSPKKQIYRSKYPYDLPPTGSTFCHVTTSKPGIGNLSGQFYSSLQAHTEKGNRSTMGYLKNDRKSSPQNFIKKHTGMCGNSTLPPVRNFSYDCNWKKAGVPRVNEKPVLGLKSNKDFIVSNAIQNIISSAKKLTIEKNWTQKSTYGKVPQYLHRIKDNISQEYTMIQNLHNQSQQTEKKSLLPPEQVQEIRQGLKRRWNQINKEYQRQTHIKLIDSQGIKRRRDNNEAQLKQIQQDIKKLNKAYIFVQQ